jgi:3',5'-cyclic AMP phosphodiesterase CpdA
MHIIHLSDTHFGNNYPAFNLTRLKQAINSLSELFMDPNTYFVVSGDITFKGNPSGYIQAKNFFIETWLKNRGDRKRFLACPGNHDICDKSFEQFDSFLYSIRRDHLIDLTKEPHSLVEFDNIAFLMINSAYTLDYKYGLIDCESLKSFLEKEQSKLNAVQQRVAVIHHHLIGFQKYDISTIRNALPFITLMDEFKFNLILHGHQHSQASLEIGKSKIKVFSARSFNYPSLGLVNGINLFTYDQNAWDQKQLVLSDDNSTSSLSFS